MNESTQLANICRTIARIFSIIVLLLGIPFLLFTIPQLFSGGASIISGQIAILFYLLLLTGMLAGLVIAWRKEGLGAMIALVSLAGSFLMSRALLPGVGSGQGFSLFAGPINLLFALFIPGYHPEVSPIAKSVPSISWLLPTVPVVLFIASWWLRKSGRTNTPHGETP